MEAQFKILLAERKPLEAKLALLERFVNTFDSNTDILVFEKHIKVYDSLYDQLDRVQSQIDMLDLDIEAEELQLEDRYAFTMVYHSIMANDEKHIDSVRSRQQNSASHSNSKSLAPSDTQSSSQIPLIDLPTFDGESGDWIRFRDTFPSLVYNSDKLTDVDRFNYLASALRGSAALAVELLGASEKNYQLAWSRLKERHEAPKALVGRYTSLQPHRDLSCFRMLEESSSFGATASDSDADELASQVISRQVVDNITQGIEPHGFSDVSEGGYGAAVYLRTRTDNGARLPRLSCAKSCVAPLKIISLPRLELCGAVMLSQLACRVKDALNGHPMRGYYWTDSTITLAWIRSEPCRWKTFIANRVSEIQRVTSPDHWRHVISGDNPADLISRGSSPLTSSMNSLWWCGPPWLSRECHEWPSSEPAAVGIPEVRQTNVVHLATSDATAKDTFDLPSRYSSYKKLLRVTAYCFRYIVNTRDKVHTSICTGDYNSSPPTAAELSTAEWKLVSIAQQTHFANELESLTTGKPIQRQSSLASFDPVLDELGLIRVGGGLMNAPITFEQKHPVILPASHPLTSLIVRNEHSRLLHADCQRTLTSLRCRFWIISGRRLVRKIVCQCINCFRANPIGATYQMGNLPAERITPTSVFATCGVDYTGPFLMQERARGRVAHKTYVCVFVWLITEAIYIELVIVLAIHGFLSHSHRFTLRTREHNGHIQSILAPEKIEWNLVPPHAPNFQGVCESGIKFVGNGLCRVIGKQRLVCEELYTMLTQIGAGLNKAVHIELATDLSTIAFLNCLHRFISRRDQCHSIHSDNGRIFIGARNQLSKLGILSNDREHYNRVQHTLAQEKIESHLIPSYAPNFAGLWEGGIKSAKTHLRRVIGEQRLTYEELYTILTQIEAPLNTHPLYPSASGLTNLIPVSIDHVLTGDAIMAASQPDATDIMQIELNRYQLIERAVPYLWNRWHQEFLQDLQRRHKWKTCTLGAGIIGAMVLAEPNILPPTRWRLGKIADRHPGSDNVIKIAALRISGRTIQTQYKLFCRARRKGS